MRLHAPGLCRWRRTLLTLTLLTLAPLTLTLLVGVAPAGAQDDLDEDPPPLGEFRATAIDTVLEGADQTGDDEPDDREIPDPVLAMDFRVDAGEAPRTDLRLVTSVHTRTETVDDLRGAMDGDLPPLFSSTSSELPDLGAGTSRVIRSEILATDLALVGEDRAGVYPLQVQLFSGARLLGTVRTSVIVVPARPLDALPTAVLLDVVLPTTPLTDDQPDTALQEMLVPDGPIQSLGAAARSLTGGGSAAGITLAVDGRTLEELSGLSDGWTVGAGNDGRAGSVVGPDARVSRRAAATVEALEDLAGRGDTELLAYPYGPADLVALVRGGLSDVALEAVADAGETVATALREEATRGIVLPPAGLDADTLAVVGRTDADVVVLRPDDVTFAASSALEPLRRLRTADGGEVRVLVPDEDLSALVAQDSGVMGLQRFRAETALAWLSGDNLQSTEGVLLDVDGMDLAAPGGDPGVGRVDLDRLRGVLAESIWLRPVSLSTLASTLRPSPRLVRLDYDPASRAVELPPDYIAAYADARDALEPLGSMLPTDDRSPSSFAQLLEPMPSVRYRPPSRQTAGLLRGNQVVTRLDALMRSVQILPSAPITLTATTGQVPVTITSSSDVALQVRVAVESSRFEFDDGSTREVTIAPGASQRLSFAARSLNPGGFAPISVALTDPPGTVTLATTQLSVRSTAIPIVGLVATIGSALVLVVWTVRRGRRRSVATRDQRDLPTESAA